MPLESGLRLAVSTHHQLLLSWSMPSQRRPGVVEELRHRFALDTAGGLILGLGVDASSCTVSVLLPGGPADPDRSSSTEERVEVGDIILSVGGVCMRLNQCEPSPRLMPTHTHSHTIVHVLRKYTYGSSGY